MKDAFRQGKRDALAHNPRFRPSWALDRENYDRGYDEGLKQVRQIEELDAERAKKEAEGLGGQVFKHVKTGRVYEVVCEAQLEGTLEPAVVYKLVGTEETWVRPREEFLDGRFEALS